MTYVDRDYDRDYDFIAHPLRPTKFRDVDDGDRVDSHRLRVGLLLGTHQLRLGSIRPGGGARPWMGRFGGWLSS